jgi:RNA ligase (TIGR02306 family)
MSLFSVMKLKILAITPAQILNSQDGEKKFSDNLNIVSFDNVGWQVIANKDTEYVEGEEVLYFPPDSLLPEELINSLGLAYLADGYDTNENKIKNRVRAIRLLGNRSEGMILLPARVFEIYPLDISEQLKDAFIKGDNAKLTELLGVQKFENRYERHSEKSIQFDTALIKLPQTNGGVKVYDIERWQNFPHILDFLMNQIVWISEKLHGDNGGITIDENGNIFVFQRKWAIRGEGTDTNFYPDSFNSFARVQLFRSLGYFEKIIELKEYIRQNYTTDISRVTLRGEQIGEKIQSNYYKIGKRRFYAFEIEVDGDPIPANDFMNICEALNIPIVPTISRGTTLENWLNGQNLGDVCEGKSQINPLIIREGIVIKPEFVDTYIDNEWAVLKAVATNWLQLMGK